MLKRVSLFTLSLYLPFGAFAHEGHLKQSSLHHAEGIALFISTLVLGALLYRLFAKRRSAKLEKIYHARD